MAGLGNSWGTREELLHPRDSHGRFRDSWKMAANVVEKIAGFLERFNPRTFPSDGAAAQYAFNLGQRTPGRFGGGEDLHRLRVDYGHANHALRLGQMDPETKKFVDMMDHSAMDAPDDMIVSRTVGPDAFGLPPDSLDHLEEFTGKLIADRGYGAGRIGTPQPGTGQGPRIQMSIAVPKGTRIIVPGEDRADRRVFFDRNQELRITKVRPDGSGGFYVMAVAQPRTPGETPEPVRQLSPSGVTPTDRAARIAESQQLQRARIAPAPPPTTEPAPAEPGAPAAPAAPNAAPVRQPAPAVPAASPAPAPAAPAPRPAAAPAAPAASPGAPPPRTETPVSRVIGQGGGAPAAPATPAAPAAPAAPSGPANPFPTPEVPGTVTQLPGADFRDAVRKAGVQTPAAGPHRRQWNLAFFGVLTGKKHPEDAVRELDSDIAAAKAELAQNRAEGKHVGSLPGDVTALEGLRETIAKHYNLQDGQTPKAPEAPRAPEKPKAPEAPKTAPSGPTPAEKLKVWDSLRKDERDRRIKRGESAKDVTAADVARYQAETKIDKNAISEKVTVAELRKMAKDRGIDIPSNMKLKADIRRHIESGGKAEWRMPEAKPTAPGGAAKISERTTLPELRKIAQDRGIDIPEGMRLKADIRRHIDSGGKAEWNPPAKSAPAAPAKAAKAATKAISERTTLPELRKIAQERGIDIPEGMKLKADIRRHIDSGGKAEWNPPAPRAARKATAPKAPAAKPLATKAASIFTPEEKAKMPTYDPGATTTPRMMAIDMARSAAETLAHVDTFLDPNDEHSTETIARMLRAQRSKPHVPGKLIDSLEAALKKDGPAGMRREVTRLERRLGLTPIGETGGLVPFEKRTVHEPIVGGGNPIPGTKMGVVRRGYYADIAGEKVLVAPAKVEHLSPAEITAIEKAKAPGDAGAPSSAKLRERAQELLRQQGGSPTDALQREREARDLTRQADRLDAQAKRVAAKATSRTQTPKPAPSAPSAPYSARQQRVREVSARKDLEVRGLSGGQQGTTTLETAPDGTQIVRKQFRGNDIREMNSYADAEELGTRLLDAVGIVAPAVVRSGDYEVSMQHMPGKVGAQIYEWTTPVPQEVLDSHDARLIGLIDFITSHPDRNTGNWIRTPDGRIAAIDNSLMFAAGDNPRHRTMGLVSSFARYLREVSEDKSAFLDVAMKPKVDVSPGDVQKLRKIVDDLRPEFERLNRLTWWGSMMRLLDMLEKRAVGTKDLIT